LKQKAVGLAQKIAASLPKTEGEDSARRGGASSWDFRSLGLSWPTNAGCSPGANVGAVWYRVEMLGLLEELRRTNYLSEIGPPLSEIANLPGFDNSKPSDPVFKALAVVPMTGLAHPRGSPSTGFPVDIGELTRLISGYGSPNPR
jgi:hypothetical protein